MLFVVEEIIAFEDTLLIRVGIDVQVEEQLNLIQWLIHIVFVIWNHLHTELLASSDIQNTDSSGELGTPEDVNNLVSSCNRFPFSEVESSLLLESNPILIIYYLQVVDIIYCPIELHWVEIILNSWEFQMFR